MGEMEQLMGLRTRAHQLEVELKSVNELLETLGDGANHKSSHHKPSQLGLPPPSKSGHLFKWQDRQIGFGGSKWALRFVKLEMGRNFSKLWMAILSMHLTTTVLRSDGKRMESYVIRISIT